jgi:hypothetical protein
MKIFLPFLFSLLFISAKASAQNPWSCKVGFDVMPQTYIPKNDVYNENRLRLGYALGPSVSFHKDYFCLNARLRYSRINIRGEFADEVDSPVFGYYKIESDYKQSQNNMEFSLLPGIELGKSKNKFSIHAGAIVSYLYGVRYSGTITINSQAMENSGYNQKEDWIWQSAFALAYIYVLNDDFNFKLGPQIQYSFENEYLLVGINFGINYTLSPLK